MISDEVTHSQANSFEVEIPNTTAEENNASSSGDTSTTPSDNPFSVDQKTSGAGTEAQQSDENSASGAGIEAPKAEGKREYPAWQIGLLQAYENEHPYITDGGGS
ncbi:uncharacterized protein I206_100939 [Kwoniella pini CBS 10737]|uniref:Uncharacterized protein n=1 Tax=Kwoniella pini CBS 10737 TaxID=1296096 RepID=A0A1B9IC41_9TREE|nr:uncharacterized protein I206_00387 [Kwoniella pini CBS 10737]OCF53086.1 hypothetical protein I206_00387 [Kwoniella pini CBS 10737]